jgi:hypothetical protein
MVNFYVASQKLSIIPCLIRENAIIISIIPLRCNDKLSSGDQPRFQRRRPRERRGFVVSEENATAVLK